MIESVSDGDAFTGIGLGRQKVHVLDRDPLCVRRDVEVDLFDPAGIIPLHQRIDADGSDAVGRYRQILDRSEVLDDPDDEGHRIELVGRPDEHDLSGCRHRVQVLFDGGYLGRLKILVVCDPGS